MRLRLGGDVATGGMGVIATPHFCQDGIRDFLKTHKKIGVGRG